jgi:3D (Asp-Asp-Asp) domain-containing protein
MKILICVAASAMVVICHLPAKTIAFQNLPKTSNLATVPLPTSRGVVEAQTAIFTAYTANMDECGKNNGITASGRMVKEHHTLACPPELKLGTKINIDGLGTYTCDDRGGAIKGRHFDIYMDKEAMAMAWGVKKINYKII